MQINFNFYCLHLTESSFSPSEKMSLQLFFLQSTLASTNQSFDNIATTEDSSNTTDWLYDSLATTTTATTETTNADDANTSQVRITSSY